MIPPAQQQQIADTLEDDAEVMSNTQLEPLLADEPEDVQAEILGINKDARDRSLQVALLVRSSPASSGCSTGFRMRRLPDPSPGQRRGRRARLSRFASARSRRPRARIAAINVFEPSCRCR